MPSRKKDHPAEKSELHPRNRHRGRYDFKNLIGTYPELRRFVTINDYGDESINFFDPAAVKTLNKALLKHFYSIRHWDIPHNYLCPPIPGRADYIHYAADLLASENSNVIPRGRQIKCLDIGVGANCIYPIIGAVEYSWSFVGADIDAVSVQSATHIAELNPLLQDHIACRLQADPNKIFHGIIKKDEYFDLTVCNPPFHSSAAEAQSGTLRKLSNLKGRKMTKSVLNFGGRGNELWCEGGEERFVADMIRESKLFSHACLWFTTLISRRWNVNTAVNTLKQVGAADVKTIPMSQGSKSSRIVAWTFLNAQQRSEWAKSRWKPGN
jgi:23S rRNA (adenine1618-N6)-methyltransferase